MVEVPFWKEEVKSTPYVEGHMKMFYKQTDFGIFEGLINSGHCVRRFGRAGRSKAHLEI